MEERAESEYKVSQSWGAEMTVEKRAPVPYSLGLCRSSLP